MNKIFFHCKQESELSLRTPSFTLFTSLLFTFRMSTTISILNSVLFCPLYCYYNEVWGYPLWPSPRQSPTPDRSNQNTAMAQPTYNSWTLTMQIWRALPNPYTKRDWWKLLKQPRNIRQKWSEPIRNIYILIINQRKYSNLLKTEAVPEELIHFCSIHQYNVQLPDSRRKLKWFPGRRPRQFQSKNPYGLTG